MRIVSGLGSVRGRSPSVREFIFRPSNGKKNTPAHPVYSLQLSAVTSDLCAPPPSLCRSIVFHLNLHTLPSRVWSLVSQVSSHPVLPHQRDDAGGGPRLGQEGVFEKLAGRGPLSWVPH
ncbi:hypothetical protein F7725_020424 [Dissostichus mawsoni]|uniref:Uncharacterized protein n=1 Tax=Dissostichus mawsoni TaxID=36200 RepID=A0A7J5YD59_DISMA|nr:hypothetical protein F7725_020424 [Dissostichus mawsoni]